jgi:hypothetical protein
MARIWMKPSAAATTRNTDEDSGLWEYAGRLSVSTDGMHLDEAFRSSNHKKHG